MATGQTQKRTTGNTAGGMMESTMDTAKDVAGKAADMAKDAVSTVAKKAGEAGSFLAEKADDATCAIGSGVESFAHTLERGGRYLQEHGLSGIASDLTETIRRHPVPAMLIGVALGFLVARALRS
jgi:hypothetical protein